MSARENIGAAASRAQPSGSSGRASAVHEKQKRLVRMKEKPVRLQSDGYPVPSGQEKGEFGIPSLTTGKFLKSDQGKKQKTKKKSKPKPKTKKTKT